MAARSRRSPTSSGAAITGTSLLITNAATGRIIAGATAISANPYLTLTNAGTINGSVTFSAGSDTLVAGWNGGLVTGIIGVIDSSGGTDTVQVRFACDTTLVRTITLPTNFEQLSLAPEAEITTTLADGFAAPSVAMLNPWEHPV